MALTNRMQGRPALVLAGCAVTVLLMISILFLNSSLHGNIFRGHFERDFVFQKVINASRVLYLGYNSYYMAGTDAERIYLGNWTNPYHVLVINAVSLDTQHVNLNIKAPLQTGSLDGFRIKIDSPYFFLLNGTVPSVLRGKVDEWVVDDFAADYAYFVDATPTGPSSFAVRSLSVGGEGYELGRLSDSEPHFEFKNDLLEKQVDGVFCVDGQMHYNQQLKKVVYLYYYRNEYVVSNRDLELSYRANTIDSFSRVFLSVVDIQSTGSKMLASPPAIVNAHSCVFGRWLFVQSKVMGAGESVETFKENDVIDAYDLSKGRYSYSFYVNRPHKAHLKEFQVFQDNVAVLHDRSLAFYPMNLSDSIGDDEKNTASRSGINAEHLNKKK